VTQCVWIESGSEVEFKETNIPELSTMAHLSDSDSHSAARFHGKKYLVRTISLNDMLTLNNAPNDPDYLSIDTEGSEYEILSTLDFEKYKFRVITCEHNYSANREKIASLLISKGYSRVRTDISKFDDWFVLGNS
jgi:FkbM family methyltransferase